MRHVTAIATKLVDVLTFELEVAEEMFLKTRFERVALSLIRHHHLTSTLKLVL